MLPQARHDNLLVQEVQDEIIVYDQARHRMHRLNSTAANVWRSCDGTRTIGELSDLLSVGPAQGPDKEPAQHIREEIVWLALGKLEKAHLLQGKLESRATPGQEARDPSRRRWMRRMAVAGGAMLALPVISSLNAPTPVLAQSPGGGGGGGGGGDDDDSHLVEVALGTGIVAGLAGSGGAAGGATSCQDRCDDVVAKYCPLLARDKARKVCYTCCIQAGADTKKWSACTDSVISGCKAK
jgi:hypothetical protein